MKSKFLIATTMWKRPEVFKVFVQNNKKYADILTVGSEGSKSRNLAEGLGCIYLEAPNEPLGRKFNYRTRWFAKSKYTHIILLGSDDIISDSIFNKIKQEANNYDLISWKDLYFYNLETGEGYYSYGYSNHRKGEPLAPGRCISKNAVINLGVDLWPNGLKKHPDGKLWRNKLSTINKKIVFSCKENSGYIIDIKSKDSISSFDLMKTTMKTRQLNDKEISDIRSMINNDK